MNRLERGGRAGPVVGSARNCCRPTGRCRPAAGQVLVRPEAVVVTPTRTGDTVVVVATFRGSTTRLRLLAPDGFELLADVASHRAGADTRSPRLGSLLDRPVLLAADVSAPDRSRGATRPIW